MTAPAANEPDGVGAAGDAAAVVPPPLPPPHPPESVGGPVDAAASSQPTQMLMEPLPPAVASLHLAAMSRWERRDAWLEMAVAVSVGVLPLLVSAVLSHGESPSVWAAQAWYGVSASYLAQSLSITVPILWIIHRSGLGWAYYGVVRVRPLRDGPWGLAVFALMWVAMWVCWWGLSVAALVPMLRDAMLLVPAAATAAESAGAVEARHAPWPLFLLSLTLTTSTEELFTRAYLVPALARLSRSPWVACCVAAALMASYHIYQGSFSVLIIFFSQWALNGMFWRHRRIWPFMLAHAAYDAAVFWWYPQ